MKLNDLTTPQWTMARRAERMNPSVIREILKVTEKPGIISFAGGLPSPKTFPIDAFSEACAKVLREDGQGALQTDVNVSLPWAKTVTLNPGVSLSSVTATSVTGQLNCSISDGSGAAVAVQNNNTLITTCTK